MRSRLSAGSAKAAPRFDARQFFEGKTEGNGELTQLFASTKAIRVEGRGRIEADGTLVLDQIVHGVDDQPKRREWRIRETSPGHYGGTLSDATSAVRGEVRGNMLHLAFTMKGGLSTQQWLVMADDGRSVQNRMTVKKFGLKVASLQETIRKID